MSSELTPLINYRKIDTTSERHIEKDNEYTILNNALHDENKYNDTINGFNNEAPYNIKYNNTNKIKDVETIDEMYKDELQSVKNTYTMSAYTKLIDEILKTYDDLYNNFCGNVSRAGKGEKITFTNKKCTKNIPCIRAEGTDVNNIDIYVIIRGLPVPMKKFNITDVASIFLYPEYIFRSPEAIDSFDYLYATQTDNIIFYKGNEDSQNKQTSNKYSSSIANLNLIN